MWVYYEIQRWIPVTELCRAFKEKHACEFCQWKTQAFACEMNFLVNLMSHNNSAFRK